MPSWSKRTTFNAGNGTRRTYTQNLSRGNTFSSSQKLGNTRFTQTQMPNGKIKTTKTINQGGWVKREVSTFGGATRTKKPKTARSRGTKSRRMTKAEAEMWAAVLSSKWFWIIGGLVLLIGLLHG
jgi:hypothetical protein